MTQESLYAILEDRYGKEHRVCVARYINNDSEHTTGLYHSMDYLSITIGDGVKYAIFLDWDNYSPTVELLFTEIDKQLSEWKSKIITYKAEPSTVKFITPCVDLPNTTELTREEKIALITKQLLDKLMKKK